MELNLKWNEEELLFHREATGLFDCLSEFLDQLFIGLVWWNVNSIETGMCLGQIVGVCFDLVNCKQARASSSCGSLKCFEA